LEDKFFAEHDRKLLQALRDDAASKERKQALSEASGITDDALLTQLHELEFQAETMAALFLVPLIAVAWADGKMDAKEREAVLEAAEQKGVEKGLPAHDLLENWLARKPDEKLLTVWKGCAATLSEKLDEGAKKALKEDVLGWARTVAEAAGGLLGFGNKVSKTEKVVLDELEQAFG
jgi:tellurite resistance protein